MSEMNMGDIPVSELSHYGVKGMKWGVRKKTIKSARNEVRGEKRGAKEDYKTGKITKEQKKARVSAVRRSEAGHTARTLTRGEQVVSSIIFGPTIPLSAAGHLVYSVANDSMGESNTNVSNAAASLKNRRSR